MAYVEALMEVDIDFGRRVLQLLRERKKFPFQGVFWLLNESGLWHLTIATVRLDEVGPRKAYEELEQATQLLSTDSSQFIRIDLISPKHPFYQGLKAVYGKNSVEGTRLSNTQIHGMYIDAAYLYDIR